MRTAAESLQKAERAMTSARLLLEAKDADGASSRAYFGLYLIARAALIAAGGTTGNEISRDKGRVIEALRRLIDDQTLWGDLFEAWIEAESLQLAADYGRQPVSTEKVRALLERIDALVAPLSRLFPAARETDQAETVLVLATGESACGHLKHAKIGTRHEVLHPTLVWGPLPQANSYFAAREETVLADGHWFQPKLLNPSHRWPGLSELVEQHDRTELWIDPDPNSQLTLLFLLDYLCDDNALLEKMRLHQSPVRLGERPAEESAISVPPLRPIDPKDAALASQVWRAYAAPTPEAILPLLRTDLSPFPFLHGALLALLEELPGVEDGLGTTQRSLLHMLAQGVETPHDLFSGLIRTKKPPTFGYWQIGAILDDLCRCREPAISGLDEGPFTLEMHDDPERFRRHRESRLALSDFGRALLGRQADFAKNNKIERWWGGTALRNDALWRWDRDRCVVVAD